MSCDRMREKLAQYLDGECTYYEQKQIMTHLSSCPECRKEMTELSELTSLMWELPSQTAPPDFLEGVMSAIESRDMHDKTDRPGTQQPIHRAPWETLRDLALAAAVSLAVFWYGGAWFNSESVISAGNKLDLAFKSYVQYSGGTLNRVYSNVEDLNGTILKER